MVSANGALFREPVRALSVSQRPAEQNHCRGRTTMNNNEQLNGKRIAILATEGVEQSELEQPREALDRAGAETDLVSPMRGEIHAWDEDDFGDTFEVDVSLDDARAEDYDGLMLPGGV